MSHIIKKHRRNIAVQHCEDHYRQSVPYAPTQSFRISSLNGNQSPMIFRQSDIPNVHFHPPSRKHLKLIGKTNQQSIPVNRDSNLMNSFEYLSLKLMNAKLLLRTIQQKDHFISQSHNDKRLNYKPSSQQSHLIYKMEQSTINLESQKKLINIKSKEKLIWVNKIKHYYLTEVAKGVAGINDRAFDHITLSLEILNSCKASDLPGEAQIPRNRVELPFLPLITGRKVLIIDLDETLFHCNDQRKSPDDIEIDFASDDENEKGYISIRPYALSFLKKSAKHFEVIAFTASKKSYANAILDVLDYQHELIHHRLYRQHCICLQDNIYAKDLTIINRPLSQMVLVDNSPFSYLYQRDNAIPILPYTGEQDLELLGLQRYLEQIMKAKDVRTINAIFFQLQRYSQFEECEDMVRQLYYPIVGQNYY